MIGKIYFGRVFLAFVLAAFGAAGANAECQGSSGFSYCDNVQIETVTVDGGTSNWITTTGTEANLECTPDSGTSLKIDTTGANADWLLSTILTAYSTKVPVFIRVNSSGQCLIYYVRLQAH